MNRKITINTKILIVVLLTVSSILVCVTVIYLQTIPTVNGDPTEPVSMQQTFALGEVIYSKSYPEERFYYHGIAGGSRLIIGHSVEEAAYGGIFSSNIYVPLKDGSQAFRLLDRTFTIQGIDLEFLEITLQWVE